MTKELRPCTFCGRTEYVRVEVVDELVETGTEEDPEPSKVPIFAVYCGYCGASGPQELDSDDAAHAWNRRAERTCRHSKVRKAFEISNGMDIGVVIPDGLVSLIRDYITGLLEDNISKLTALDWTLNRTWKEDGEQVACYFPEQYDTDDFVRETLEELSDERGQIVIRVVNFTDELDRDKVGELCGMVARGEIEVSDAD